MDPSSARDPSSLIDQLIDLLRAIKDGGVPEQAAAAVDAIQVVAARSKDTSHVVSTQQKTAPPLLPDTVSSPESHSASSQQLPSTSAAPPLADTAVAHNDAPALPLDALAPPSGAQGPLPDAPTVLDTRSPHEPSPAVIPTSTTSASQSRSGPTRRATVPPPQETPGAGPSPPRSRERAPDGAKPSAKPQPEATTHKPRNLIVCIDGTSNQFGKKNTNVVELYHRLIKDGCQLTFYNSGIGTYAVPSWKSWRYYKQVIYNKIDLAIAWNFEKILLSAYLWLCENYQEGDKIYLFGFSRGAYQVRALSAMIESVGLLYKGNQDQIPFAYQLYAETKYIGEDIIAMRERFKSTFSWKITVEFVGVWDTVSSVGFIRDKTLPGTTDGMQHVRYFRHALALHERRVKFLPENSREGSGPSNEDVVAEPGRRPHTKEVWFAGSHSDIGGGAIVNERLDAFGPALRWMTFEATLAGVRMSDAPQEWEDVAIYNSLTPIWKIFEVFPFARLTYRDKPDKGLTYRPHLGRPRKIQENQLIHETALDLWAREFVNDTSRWRARLPQRLRWNKHELQQQGLVEADPYTAASHYLEMIAKPEFSGLSGDDIVGIRTLLSTEIGQRSLRDIQTADETLNHGIHCMITLQDSSEQDYSTLDILLFVMEEFEIVYTRSPVSEARDYARRILQTDEKLARRLADVCALGAVSAPFRHPSSVLCVAYMPGGDCIVSGCFDGAVRVWNVETGEIVGAPMTGHTESVWSVAVSADGTQIASGSDDHTIRVWSVETGATIALLEGHEDGVRSVAFSPNGLRVVSSSFDNTIRVWDVASGKTVVGPIQGRTYGVNSVAYSLDGSQIASGSIDCTVRAWNVKTGDELWRAEMPSLVYSVAYSPDGNQIVAGCMDRTVHVLDAETGVIVLGPLTGHTKRVLSVAFSPDGMKIASGSWDGTVRLWDAETGEGLDVLRCHRYPVSSVSFSPDGKHVASSSYDKTVRIWDATGEWKRL